MSASSSTRTRPATRSRATRTRPEERRRQLLDHAEELLERGGSDALRMDTLAGAAGVTRPVVYSHFDNRDGLIVALLERHEKRLSSDDEGERAAEGFESLIRRATISYLEASVAHGTALRALVAGANLSPPIEQTRRRIWDAGVGRWALNYRRFFGLTAGDAHALALSHLTGLSAMAGMCASGTLTIRRATELHVTSVLSSLTAVAGQGPRP